MGEFLFTVVIPAFNREEWVAEAVESALAQGRSDYEVIVVDDGSTDATPQILSRYADRARIIRQENAGVSVARNRGIEAARGKWIAFLDADDRWRPGHLDRLAQAIARYPDAGLIYTDVMVIDEAGRPLKIKRSPPLGRDPFRSLLLANTITTSSAAVRRSCFERIGLFLPGLRSAQDWDVWLRGARYYSIVHIPEVSVDYRRQPRGTVHTRGLAMREDNLLVLRRAAALAPELEKPLLRRAEANIYYESGVRMLAAGKTQLARKELAAALRRDPRFLRVGLLWALALAGPEAVERVVGWRRRRQEKNALSEPRVRVVHLITDSGIGGAEKILSLLISRLNPRQYECGMITLKRPGFTAARLAGQGIAVSFLGLPSSFSAGYLLRLPLAFLRLLFLLRRCRPHILHCWLFQANLLGRMAAWAVGVPVNISSLRVVEQERRLQYPLDRLTQGLVSHYVAVSEAVAGHYRPRLGMREEKMTVIPNGIEMPSTHPPKALARHKLGLPLAAPVIGGLGRLHRQKGFDLIIAALPDLLSAFPDLILLLAGAGPEEKKLSQLAARLGVARAVRWLGELKEPADFWAALDVFVLPSRWEGMPNVLLEAMAWGIPAVVADVAGVREVVVPGTAEADMPGETALLVPPEEPGELSRALRALLENCGRRERMAEAGRARVKAEFSVDRMVEAYECLYRELLCRFANGREAGRKEGSGQKSEAAGKSV